MDKEFIKENISKNIENYIRLYNKYSQETAYEKKIKCEEGIKAIMSLALDLGFNIVLKYENGFDSRIIQYSYCDDPFAETAD